MYLAEGKSPRRRQRVSHMCSKLAVVLVPSTEDNSACVSSICSWWLVLGGVALSRLVVMDSIEVSTFPRVLQVIVGEWHKVMCCGKQEPKDCMLPHLIISH